jgi:hypothetical protein
VAFISHTFVSRLGAADHMRTPPPPYPPSPSAPHGASSPITTSRSAPLPTPRMPSTPASSPARGPHSSALASAFASREVHLYSLPRMQRGRCAHHCAPLDLAAKVDFGLSRNDAWWCMWSRVGLPLADDGDVGCDAWVRNSGLSRAGLG